MVAILTISRTASPMASAHAQKHTQASKHMRTSACSQTHREFLNGNSLNATARFVCHALGVGMSAGVGWGWREMGEDGKVL